MVKHTVTDKYYSRTIARALRVLELLAEREQGLTITEIGESLGGVSKSVCYTILRTLNKLGYVQQKDGSPRYVPGLRLLTLAETSRRRGVLTTTIQPLLDRLAQVSGETCHFAVLDSDNWMAVTVAVTNSPNALRVNVWPGKRHPLHATAVGKAILAVMPHEKLEEYLQSARLERFTRQTITDPQVLRETIVRVKECGYAIDDREHSEEGRCIATGFLLSSGLPGAVSVTAPTVRLPKEKQKELVPELLQIRGHLEGLSWP